MKLTQDSFSIIMIVLLLFSIIILEIKMKGWKEGMLHMIVTFVIGTIFMGLYFFIMEMLPKC